MTDKQADNLRESLMSCKTVSDFLLFWLSNSEILNHKDRFNMYYRNFLRNFGPRMQKFYQSQSSEVVEMLSRKKKPELLDIGCGCGTETLWFAKLGAVCTGIDMDDLMIKTAQERHKIMEDLLKEDITCHFQSTSIFDLDPRDKKFDIIWMEQAFHHIEPRDNLLPLLFALLNDDGSLVIAESNAWNPLIQLRLLKLRGFKTIFYSKNGDQLVPFGNERIITPMNLTKALRQSGFIVSPRRYFRLLPSNKAFDKAGFLEAIWPRILFPAFTHYNIVARKPSLSSQVCNDAQDLTDHSQ